MGGLFRMEDGRLILQRLSFSTSLGVSAMEELWDARLAID